MYQASLKASDTSSPIVHLPVVSPETVQFQQSVTMLELLQAESR